MARPKNLLKTEGRTYRLSQPSIEKLEKLKEVWVTSKATIVSLAIDHLYQDWLHGRVQGISSSLITAESDGAGTCNEKASKVKPPVSVSR